VGVDAHATEAQTRRLRARQAERRGAIGRRHGAPPSTCVSPGATGGARTGRQARDVVIPATTATVASGRSRSRTQPGTGDRLCLRRMRRRHPSRDRGRGVVSDGDPVGTPRAQRGARLRSRRTGRDEARSRRVHGRRSTARLSSRRR
jgi:hypothetical protein